MNTVQATIYGAKMLVAMLLGQLPNIDAESTMNERLEIEGSDRPVAGETVKLGILVAGNKGHTASIGNNGIAKTSILDHFADNASLYNPMPFCMRTVDDDLDLAHRQKYALRKEITVDAVNYYAYYGLRIDVSIADVTVTMKLITTEDGVVVETVFTPNNANLYPTPVTLPSTGAVTTTDVKLAVSALLPVVLSTTDVQEYVNCAKILNGGDEEYAIMSEFGLCTGADRNYTVQSTAGSVTFSESIGTQIYAFAADHKALYYNEQELTLQFDVGNQIPMLGTQSIPTLETIGVTTTTGTTPASSA
jgi:hypothetical protein